MDQPGNTYCSNRCQQEFQHKQWIDEWFAGIIDGLEGVGPSKHIRRYLIETRGEVCEICGWAEVNPNTGTIPLHLDHIDGNWRNNRPENVRLLCPNHHALTSTYGSQNRGSGRPFIVYKKLIGE
ncbi:MAG: HNH endonuclease [Chloroflexi bacterium]|nr:HNH endonuclease [Chloroflexota bacterium]